LPWISPSAQSCSASCAKVVLTRKLDGNRCVLEHGRHPVRLLRFFHDD
jgi:hypothetical protein